MDQLPHFERDGLYLGEIWDVVCTGTHPVLFHEKQEEFIWGLGTLFVAQWGPYHFAITAKHVIENLKANYKHLRIQIPGFKIALPILGATTPQFPRHEKKDDAEDIFVCPIDLELVLSAEEALEWHAWRMERFWMPSDRLQVGQQIYAAGFPENEDRFDYENNKISAPPLVIVGKLSAEKLGENLPIIDCAEFECGLNGISGGPVFARFGGFFCYVGMIIRANREAKEICFVGAELVCFTLDQCTRQLAQAGIKGNALDDSAP